MRNRRASRSLSIIAALALFCSSCSTSKQTQNSNCPGGELEVRISETSGANAIPSTIQSARLSISNSGSNFVINASECPGLSNQSRTVTIHLDHAPSSGETIQLTSPMVAHSNYLDYSETLVNSSSLVSLRSWVAGGILKIGTVSENEVTFSADRLVMNSRPAIPSNKASGSFRLSLQGRAVTNAYQ